MSLFNEQHYKDSIHNKVQMEIKGDAPLFSGASSPEKRLLRKLADIPEASPGPNAFAAQAERIDSHRLSGNAFYQQEMQRRVAPPTHIHPALRQRSASDPPTPPRDSFCTTMSPFVNAGRYAENSLPLKLVPSNDVLAEATQRALIEEAQEQLDHKKSGSEEGRTPVFISSSTFPQTSNNRIDKQKEVTIMDLPAKTPKRSLLEKLRLNTNFRHSPSMSAMAVRPDAEIEDAMPVKAKAVLGPSPPKKSRASFGASPSKSNLPRSPSKRKGFFGRKSSGFADSTTRRSKSAFSSGSAESDQPPPSASTVTKTPPTASSDPSHYSYNYNGTSFTPHTSFDKATYKESDTNKCTIARSQSLKYFDHTVPPTPPTKDTPPDEKVERLAEFGRKSSRVPFHDEQTTPSAKSTGLSGTSDHFSPTKFGNYGYRDTPKLVTKPSMYSLHASVVPNMTEASAFEELKARIDGLGLEGFSLPPENMRGHKRGTIYSPSIYSTDWGARPHSVFECCTPPMMQQPLRHTKKASDDSKGSSSGGEIPMVYPELAKDPSYGDLTPGAYNVNRGRDTNKLHVKIPWHGAIHSRDHSSDSRNSRDSAIFAHHVDGDPDKELQGTPTPFSHPSATPSPLQMLPATAYKPPPRKSSMRRMLTADEIEEILGRRLNDQAVVHVSAKPSPRRNELFDNAPTLPAQSSPIHRRAGSPQYDLCNGQLDADVNVDPQKPSSSKSPATEKLDRMLEMLDSLNSRNNEISTMRDEMRASNARLGERLAAVENLQRSSPVSSSGGSDESLSLRGATRTSAQKRVSTVAAHEFYRADFSGHDGIQEDEEEYEVVREGHTPSDTIAQLRETNIRLIEMVRGFAQKIKSLERRTGANGGF